jgi:hypothetical protein
VCGGHFSARTTAHKVMRVGYYWPTLFADVHAYVRACEPCQRFEGKQKLPALPLDPVIVEAPFQQWGLDFIGQLSQASSGGHSWILVATDYFTRWVEAIPLKSSSSANIVKFLEENIITVLECPTRSQQIMPVSSDPLSWWLFVPSTVLRWLMLPTTIRRGMD